MLDVVSVLLAVNVAVFGRGALVPADSSGAGRALRAVTLRPAVDGPRTGPRGLRASSRSRSQDAVQFVLHLLEHLSACRRTRRTTCACARVQVTPLAAPLDALQLLGHLDRPGWCGRRETAIAFGAFYSLWLQHIHSDGRAQSLRSVVFVTPSTTVVTTSHLTRTSATFDRLGRSDRHGAVFLVPQYEVVVERAASERVGLRVAADADVAPLLPDDPDAAGTPRGPQLALGVGELAVLLAAAAVAVVPTQADFIREALVARVPLLAASEADHRPARRLDEVPDIKRGNSDMNLLGRHHRPHHVLLVPVSIFFFM